MKLLTFIHDGAERIGVLSADGLRVVPVSKVVDRADAETMTDLIAGWSERTANMLLKAAENGRYSDEFGIPISNVAILAPIPRPARDVICLGMNYHAHAAEASKFAAAFESEKEKAVYFSKRVTEAVADGGGIDGHFDIVDSLDYEAELAVIIGKSARNVSKADAYNHVFGYTILNDISARNLQTAHKQFYFGKSLDGFTPMGPWIVTEDEFENPPALRIRCYVNGELRQDSRTDLHIHSVAEVISELSQGMELGSGTIIAMGTPAGVGMGMDPPTFLKSGDEVRCEIERIGTLTNRVV